MGNQRDDGARTARARHRRPAPLWLSLLGNLLVALVIVSLVQAFLIRVHTVSSGSMQATLGIHDRVLSSNLPYLAGSPQRGDIVIFGHGTTWEDANQTPDPRLLWKVARGFGDLTGIGVSNQIFTVKRVIGVPGDTVECCSPDGRVLVDDEPLVEPYIHRDFPFTSGGLDCSSQPRSVRCFPEISVPVGKYLVLGDHRSNSADSVVGCRGLPAASGCARLVPADRITGKVVAKAWPPGPVG